MKRLQNKKVYVGKYSKEIQEKAFELGFSWSGDKVVDFLDKPFLFFGSDKHIMYVADVKIFNSHEYEEITAEEILSMKVETKFKPFERVLVKTWEDGEWRVNIYSHYDSSLERYPHVCIGGSFARCIPYEGNEELLGTNKMTNN